MSDKSILAAVEAKLGALEKLIEDLDEHIRKTQQRRQRVANELRHLKNTLKELADDGLHKAADLHEK